MPQITKLQEAQFQIFRVLLDSKTKEEIAKELQIFLGHFKDTSEDWINDIETRDKRTRHTFSRMFSLQV